MRKILVALVVFVGLVTSPFWAALAGGKAESAPDLVIGTDKADCVESVDFMRKEHMKLLEDWRESVVRDGDRSYASSLGVEYQKSLTGTCLDCHSNKSEFCDRCHEYAGVQPDCWNCHIAPEGE